MAKATIDLMPHAGQGSGLVNGWIASLGAYVHECPRCGALIVGGTNRVCEGCIQARGAMRAMLWLTAVFLFSLLSVIVWGQR